MKRLITYFSKLFSPFLGLQSRDVSTVLAFTVGSPSADRRDYQLKPFIRFAVILCLLLAVGVGNSWAADVVYTFSSATNNPGSGNDWYSDDIDSYTSWEATNGSTASNHPKYYSKGTGLRVYSGGTFTITSTKTMSSIKFTFSGTSYTFSSSSTTTPLTVNPDASSYEVTVTRSHCRLQSIEITYAAASAYTVRFYTGSGTYTDLTEAGVGSGVTPPSMTASCSGFTFQGWSEEDSDDDESTDELELVELTDGKYYPGADITLYPVYTKTVGGGTTWTKMTTNPVAGDVVILVCESYTVEGKDKTQSKYITTDSYTSTPSGLLPFTVGTGYSSGTLYFKNGNDYLQYNGSNNELNQSTTLDNKSSWTVSVNGSGTATITNKASTSRVIKYNSGSPRFACYTSGQNAIQLYKQTSSSTTYYYSYPTCCTPLGTINGSFSLSQHSPSSITL